MSLKAKIEAVLYAADDPVTLAQLVALFGEEALAARPQEGRFAFGPTVEESHESDGSDVSGLDAGLAAAESPEVSSDSESPAPPIDDTETKRQLRLREREARAAIEKIVDDLIAEYSAADRGMEIRDIAGGYRIATRAEYHDAVRQFVKNLKPQMKFSLQALETLAVVAYKQPITAPEISEIRGVDTSGVLGGLMARKLIATAGRKQVIGRPILYKTTKEFLLRFGLKDVRELPSMEEFEKMAADMAGEMEEGSGSAGAEDGAESPSAADGIAAEAGQQEPTESSSAERSDSAERPDEDSNGSSEEAATSIP